MDRIQPIGPRPDVTPVRPVVLAPREREERKREREERRRRRAEDAREGGERIGLKSLGSLPIIPHVAGTDMESVPAPVTTTVIKER